MVKYIGGADDDLNPIFSTLYFGCFCCCLYTYIDVYRRVIWGYAHAEMYTNCNTFCVYFYFVRVCAAFTSIHNKNLKATCNLIDKRKSMCSVSVTGCNLNAKMIHLEMGREKEKDHLVLVD